MLPFFVDVVDEADLMDGLLELNPDHPGGLIRAISIDKSRVSRVELLQAWEATGEKSNPFCKVIAYLDNGHVSWSWDENGNYNGSIFWIEQ